jgi:hypothetical protein
MSSQNPVEDIVAILKDLLPDNIYALDFTAQHYNKLGLFIKWLKCTFRPFET